MPAAQGDHQLVGLGIAELSEPLPEGVTYLRYGLSRGNTLACMIGCWMSTASLSAAKPVLWRRRFATMALFLMLSCSSRLGGSSVFTRCVACCSTSLLPGIFHNSRGFDYDFDPELQELLIGRLVLVFALNANPLLMLQASSWNITLLSFSAALFQQSGKTLQRHP